LAVIELNSGRRFRLPVNVAVGQGRCRVCLLTDRGMMMGGVIDIRSVRSAINDRHL
jgi:hypothetical protein